MRIFRIIYGGDQEYFALHSPWAVAERNAAAICAAGQVVRMVVGGSDPMLYFNNIFQKHLTDLGIPHTFTVVPSADHRTLVLLNGLGEANWQFYRTVFGDPQAVGQEG